MFVVYHLSVYPSFFLSSLMLFDPKMADVFALIFSSFCVINRSDAPDESWITKECFVLFYVCNRWYLEYSSIFTTWLCLVFVAAVHLSTEQNRRKAVTFQSRGSFVNGLIIPNCCVLCGVWCVVPFESICWTGSRSVSHLKQPSPLCFPVSLPAFIFIFLSGILRCSEVNHVECNYVLRKRKI